MVGGERAGELAGGAVQIRPGLDGGMTQRRASSARAASMAGRELRAGRLHGRPGQLDGGVREVGGGGRTRPRRVPARGATMGGGRRRATGASDGCDANG
jgi:hypothetical protein